MNTHYYFKSFLVMKYLKWFTQTDSFLRTNLLLFFQIVKFDPFLCPHVIEEFNSKDVGLQREVFEFHSM